MQIGRMLPDLLIHNSSDYLNSPLSHCYRTGAGQRDGVSAIFKDRKYFLPAAFRYSGSRCVLAVNPENDTVLTQETSRYSHPLFLLRTRISRIPERLRAGIGADRRLTPFVNGRRFQTDPPPNVCGIFIHVGE